MSPMRRRAFALLLTLLVVASPASAVPPLQDEVDLDAALEVMRWRNIGPTRGGRSVAVAGVVRDPLTYYFGGTGGGVWKTTDAGHSWNNVSDGFFKTGSVGAISVSESDPNVVYVGMGEHAVRGVTTSHGDGVYRSTDAGRTWQHMGLEKTRAIARIRVHPRNPDLVYVAAQGAPYGWTEDRGIYRSEDGGVTWEKVHHVSERAGAADLAMDMNNPRILYAAYWEHIRRPWIVESGGEGSGIWKSTDGGDTWDQLDEGLPELMGKIGIDVSRANSDRVFAIVEAEPGDGGLYRSDDGGASWEQINGERIIQTRSWYYMEVFADPQDENTVVVLNAPFMRSIDGGRTFENVQVPHGDNHDLWVNPSDNRIMINANDGGANISFDAGASWSTQQNQPTAQFYRVITDNQFPYHVYGGQQDNSAIGIPSAAPDRIGWSDFYSVSGCESAFIAFDDPDDPRRVYGTCIEGDIDVWDRVSGERKPIRPYPEFSLGVNPIDQKYRFNWNNPVLGSPHQRGVVYQAGNVLFRTEDGGQSWRAVSPDLTRNDTEKQVIGGGPITNENAGGEVYNTITYAAESTVSPGVIWVGTDDGLVQLTRDGGATWEDVTPPGVRELGRGGEVPGEALINAIEPSPHSAGRAYLAVSRYKFDDFTPYIFRTDDFGASWTLVRDGIGIDHWVRVVREDPVREHLLYAGTELGVYVSFDGGTRWHPWQLNMPVVPITDLEVKGSDLVAATQGRAFWILDDLTPLRQHDPDGTGTRLLQPRPTWAVAWGATSGVGANPPAGVQLYVDLEEGSEGPITLEILDASGEVVRTYASDSGDSDEPGDSDDSDDSALELEPGLNRVVWDLNREPLTEVPGLMVFGSMAGRSVVPGQYRARLTTEAGSQEVEIELRAVPWRAATADQYAAQEAFLADLDSQLDDLTSSVNRLWSAREQLQALGERIEGDEATADLSEAISGLVNKIESWDGTLVQRRQETFQDIINFENQLIAQLLALRGSVDGVEPPVTVGSQQRLEDLCTAWNESRVERDAIEGEIDALNASVLEAGIGAVVLDRR